MAFMDSLLSWLLYIDPLIAIIAISFIVSLVITLALKFLTNQSLMKDLRDEMKELQKEMKDLKNNPKKLQKVNSRFMETNMKYMSHSMKPTLYTFIPIILVFGWLNTHLGYYPLLPGQVFKVSAEFNGEGEVFLETPQGIDVVDGNEKEIKNREAEWHLKGEEGSYVLKFHYNEKTYEKEILITKERKYAPIEKDYRKKVLFFTSTEDNSLLKVIVGNEKVLPFKNASILRDIPWIKDWGWFGAYILFSILFSMALRKALNVY